MKSTLFISFFHVPFGTKEIHQASLIKLRSAYFHCRIYELETTTAERSWLAIYWPIPKGNLPVEIQWKRCLWFKCWSKKVQHTTGVVIVVYIHKSWYIQYTCIIYIYTHLFGWVPSTMNFSVSKKNGNFRETSAPQAIFAILKKSSLELMPTACGARVSPRLGPFILPSTKKLLPNASCAKVITWKCLENAWKMLGSHVKFKVWWRLVSHMKFKVLFLLFRDLRQMSETSSFDSSVTWIFFAST